MTSLADDVLTRLVHEQTAELLRAVERLPDADVTGRSGLPGWTRGHVLTHLARNADALANVLRSAVTGDVTPMYASAEARDADIAAGAGRGAAEQLADLRRGAGALADLLAEVPDDVLDVRVPDGRGKQVPVRAVPWLRLKELTFHHVDLRLDYRFADAPEPVLRRAIEECASRFADLSPGVDVQARLPDGLVVEVRLGDGHVRAQGDAADVLGWLSGRTDGVGLRSPEALPDLPSWG